MPLLKPPSLSKLVNGGNNLDFKLALLPLSLTRMKGYIRQRNVTLVDSIYQTNINAMISRQPRKAPRVIMNGTEVS
jgi:hypothetical protein